MKKFNKIQTFETSFLLIGLLLLVLTLNPQINSDGTVRFNALEQIIQNNVTPVAKYSNIQMYLSLPLAYYAKLTYSNMQTVVAYFNLIIFLIFGTAIFSLLIKIYSFEIATKSFLILLSGSMLPHHLQSYFGEVLSAMSIVLGILLLKECTFLSPILLGIGVANTPALIIPLCALSFFLFRRHPTIVLGLAASLFIFLGENHLKYGSVLGSSYFSAGEKGFQTVMPYSGLSGFSYPIFFGIISIIFSFGKGILFYISPIFLILDSSTKKIMKLLPIYYYGLIAFIGVLIIVYAKWWAWYGGNFWGPRFFLILVFPASLILAVNISSPSNCRKLLLLLTLVSLSTWVGINGVIFSQDNMDICWSHNYELEMLCWYTPEFSALWRPFVTFNFLELFRHIVDNKRFLFALWQFVVGIYLFTLIILRFYTDNNLKPSKYLHITQKY